jgi:hypothetical protein
MVTVRVKEKTYKELNVIAGRLQAKFKRPISANETINYLVKKDKLKPSDFAGTWSMSDGEEAEILKSLEEKWSERKYRRG